MDTKRPYPKPGEYYKHFKGGIYRIIAIAKYTEINQLMVIYQEWREMGTYARPLKMFMSEVDHEKYPNVSQKYRFEKRP